MKRTRLMISVLAVLAALAGCYSTSPVRKPAGIGRGGADKIALAVVDFENQTGDGSLDALKGAATGLMIDELQKSGAYRLIERKRLDTVLGELKLGMSGLMDGSAAKQVGKQLGVDAFLFGTISSVKHSRSKQTIFVMWTEGQIVEVSMDARIVSVGTGEILSSAKASSYVKQRAWVAFWFARLGKIMDKEAMVRTGTELCIRDIAVSLSGDN